MTDFNCRICWNTRGWAFPSGEAARLEHNTYVAAKGFGHEEWLFNYAWMIDDLKYGHLQPVTKSTRRLSGTVVNLFLYAIGPDKRTYAVGTIRDVRVLKDTEAGFALAYFNRQGWLREMAEDLQKLKLSPSPILETTGPDAFNIAFEPQKVRLFEPIQPFVDSDPNRPTVTRYILTEAVSIPTPVSGSSASRNLKTALASSRRAIPSTEIDLRHTRIQNALFAHLKGKSIDVRYEQSFVDLMFTTADGDVLLELKIASTARGSIREAIGQLLEYAHYREGRRIAKIVAVGLAPPTPEDTQYLERLRAAYALPLYYWRFDLDAGGSLTDDAVAGPAV